MPSMSGWFKFYRKAFDNPVITRSPDHIAIWLFLLCHATPKSYKTFFAGKEIILRPGQLITSRKAIADCVNSGLNDSKVQRGLKAFESAHQIEQRSSNKNRLITVLGWNKYQHGEQQNEQQMNINRTSAEHQPNTYREEREERENYSYKEEAEILALQRMAFRDVIDGGDRD